MPRSFDTSVLKNWRTPGGWNTRLWLLAAAAVLLVANLVAAILYVFPPGGSETELRDRRDQLLTDIKLAHISTARLHNVSGKVETGSQQQEEFQSQYFLPERLAYSAVIAELQRMAREAGVEEREAVYSKEPIEGSDDLSVLNAGARFQGSYANLMRFLNESDKSPMLLMIDTVRATPQQRGPQIDTEIRFQAVIHDDQSAGAPIGGQP